MTDEKDEEGAFFDRADAFIGMANEYCDRVEVGRVSSSFMFGMSRFTAWACANGFDSASAMKKERDEAVDYYVSQFRQMLSDNVDDYLKNYDSYMKGREEGSDPES